MSNNLIPTEIIESKIFLIKGFKVMLDEDLAKLYQVSTNRLNEQVKRNIKRFPKDFMFQLTPKENLLLRSQFAISKQGGRRYLPYAFTELGIAMLSSVLNSERAIQINIQIMRTFVNLRKIVLRDKKLAQKWKEFERRINKHDYEIKSISDLINKLIQIPERPKRKIGFAVN